MSRIPTRKKQQRCQLKSPRRTKTSRERQGAARRYARRIEPTNGAFLLLNFRRMPLLRMVLLTVACLFVFVLSSTIAAADERPNIVVIMADDLGYNDLGCYGCKDICTPNLDQLATDGIRFTSAYVTGNMCGPSRAGFLIGRIQSKFGYYKNVNNPYAAEQGLPKDIPTFVSILQKQGYIIKKRNAEFSILSRRARRDPARRSTFHSCQS